MPSDNLLLRAYTATAAAGGQARSTPRLPAPGARIRCAHPGRRITEADRSESGAPGMLATRPLLRCRVGKAVLLSPSVRSRTGRSASEHGNKGLRAAGCGSGIRAGGREPPFPILCADLRDPPPGQGKAVSPQRATPGAHPIRTTRAVVERSPPRSPESVPEYGKARAARHVFGKAVLWPTAPPGVLDRVRAIRS